MYGSFMSDLQSKAGKGPNMDMLPADDLAILIDKNSTLLQKKTAFKVMQRYFRSVSSKNFGQSVNLDSDYNKVIANLK